MNFRLAEADLERPEEWRTVIPGSDRVYLRGATAYRDHLAISQRVDGLDQLILRTYDGEETRIPFDEASYSAGFSGNPEFAPDAYRLHYSSMVTPLTIYDYHPGSAELETLQGPGNPVGLRSDALSHRAADGAGARRQAGPCVRRLSEGLREEWRRQALPLRLWRLWHVDPARLLDQPDQPARPRLGLCHRPCPRRRRPRLQLVSRRQADQAQQQLQRLRRCREGLDRRRLHQGRQYRDQRAARPAAS